MCFLEILNKENKMKIKEWENYVFNKYNAKKIKDVSDLKVYFTNPMHYFDCFTINSIVENHFNDEEFYSAYVFEDSKISKRKNLIINEYASWKTTIVFLASQDGSNISDIYFHSSGALNNDEYSRFLKEITYKSGLKKKNMTL